MDLKNALQQYLEDWQRAGLRQIPADLSNLDSAALGAAVKGAAPRRESPAAPTPTQASPPVARPVDAGPPAPAVVKSAEKKTRGPAQQKPPAPRTVTPQPAPNLPIVTAAAVDLPDNPTRVQREAALAKLSACVAGCTRCPELVETRQQTVFGVGNPEAEIMFIGEAPGADEDRQGIPFVGKAGQLLDKIIAASKLERDDIYICNILRCRPPGNRNPSPVESGHCREYLDGQIQIVDPDYIVCFGSVAAQNLLDVKTSIGRMRGKFMQYGRAKVMCTYHPSYLLRNESAKKQVWADMKFFMADRGIEL